MGGGGARRRGEELEESEGERGGERGREGGREGGREEGGTTAESCQLYYVQWNLR